MLGPELQSVIKLCEAATKTRDGAIVVNFDVATVGAAGGAAVYTVTRPHGLTVIPIVVLLTVLTGNNRHAQAPQSSYTNANFDIRVRDDQGTNFSGDTLVGWLAIGIDPEG